MSNCVFCNKPAPTHWWEHSGWLSVVKDEWDQWHDANYINSQNEPEPAHETCYDQDVVKTNK